MRACDLCGQDTRVATKVSVWGMYDLHLFTRFRGRTPDEVIESWRKHNATPNPAIVGKCEVDDLGKAYLCPVIVLDEKGKELRRVGPMVFPDSPNETRDLAEWRRAVSVDADIPRLLWDTEPSDD